VIPTLARVLPWAGLGVALVVARTAWVNEGRADARAKAAAQSLAWARDSVRAQADSLGALEQRLALARGRVDTLWRVRSSAIANADTFRRSADSVVAILPADSAPACRLIRTALDLRTSECAALRRAVVADSDALRGARAALDTSGSVVADLRRSNAGLSLRLADIRKAYTCRGFLFLPCLTRWESLALGAIGGFALKGFLR
jgi:hypothetical protein